MPSIGVVGVLFVLFQIAIATYTYKKVESSKSLAIFAALALGIGGIVAVILVDAILEPILVEVLILLAYEFWTRTTNVEDADTAS